MYNSLIFNLRYMMANKSDEVRCVGHAYIHPIYTVLSYHLSILLYLYHLSILLYLYRPVIPPVYTVHREGVTVRTLGA